MSVLFRFIILSALLLSLVSCSKPGGTKAGVKLNVSGISALSATAGSGGTLLFGRSTNGDLFGKVINGTEDVLNVPNGDWIFYALMWDTNASGLPMNDKVFCAKVPAKLSGTDTSLTFNLNNNTCADPDFSNGRYYTSGGLIRFADLFLEECDDLNATTNWFCGSGNQGSALSYRLKFQSFIKGPSSPFGFGNEAITSACKKIDNADGTDLMKQGMPVNFPSGNGIAPFVVSVEMFIGSQTCDTTDPKGVHTVLLQNGLGSSAAFSKVVTSTDDCSFSGSDFPSDPLEKQNVCEAYYGNWTGSSCISVPLGISRFAPTCFSKTVATPAIKQLVSMPKPVLCDKYNGINSIIGTQPFAGGNGTIERPYKICTEWQLNQIGEKTAPLSFASSSYKLMNNLDMNKTDIIGPYSKPACNGVASSVVDKHHNLNPLDKLSSDCTSFETTTYFTGFFNGNGKTINNVRIQAKNAVNLGLVKKLSGAGRIRNLSIKEMEIEGLNNVGSIAGDIDGPNNDVSNINIEKLRIEARSNNNTDGNFAGGIAGKVTSGNTKLSNVHVNGAEIRARDNGGGLVGLNSGLITKSHFRGDLSSDGSNGTFFGGLVAQNVSGSIIEHSYSEGVISSFVTNTGGIAGKNNGSINNSYSTAAIYASYPSAYNVGGIAADNTSGSIADVFFDGVISNGTGGTPTNDGIFVLGSGGSNCYSSFAGASVNGACAAVTLSSLRTSLPAFSTPANWISISGSIPRLAWENRECSLSINQASVATQATAGRGSATSPIFICNSNQLSSLSGRASTEIYRLADDIHLGTWSSPASTITAFNGQLFGNNRILYGLDLTYVVGDFSNSYEGIFKSVSSSGMIANLKLYNNKISNTAGLGDSGTGLLAGENLGTIAQIELLHGKVSAENQVGPIVGHNKGVVKKASVEQSEVSGQLSTGGIAGINATSASIIKSRADVTIGYSLGSGFEQFGGIVGTNNGTIDQVRFDGKIELPASTAPSLRAGGIAGLNSGSITNALFDNRAFVNVSDTDSVGGLIGENSGSINYSLSLGKVIYGAGVIANGDLIQPLIGYNSATAGTYLYYLEKQIASYGNWSSTTSSCTGDGSSCAVSADPVGGSDLMNLKYGGGGNGNMSTFYPMSFTAGVINYTGPNISAATDLNYYISDSFADLAGKKTVVQLTTLGTYCPGGFNDSGATGVCTGGFNIAQMEGTGSDRVLSYFMSSMYNQPTPANAPVWEFSTEEGPRLLQIEH